MSDGDAVSGGYDYSETIETGFLDTDGGGHISNVAFPKYLEVARLAFLHDRLGEHFDDVDFVLANLTLDYHSELFPGETVVVDVGLEGIGTTSFTLEYRMRVDEDVVATATTVQVVRDESGDTRPVPAVWRERLRPEATA